MEMGWSKEKGILKALLKEDLKTVAYLKSYGFEHIYAFFNSMQMRQIEHKLPLYFLMKIQRFSAMQYYLGHDKQEETSLCLKVTEVIYLNVRIQNNFGHLHGK